MDIDIKIIEFVFKLKEEKNIKYTLEDWKPNVIYAFKNYSEFKNYFINNGLNKISENVINTCIFKKLANGKVIAYKGLCDYIITKMKRPVNLTFKEIKEIHDRGNITPWEKVEEWEKHDICAPKDAARCHVFYNCHECLVNYASNYKEYVPANRIEKNKTKQLRKRNM